MSTIYMSNVLAKPNTRYFRFKTRAPVKTLLMLRWREGGGASMEGSVNIGEFEKSAQLSILPDQLIIFIGG